MEINRNGQQLRKNMINQKLRHMGYNTPNELETFAGSVMKEHVLQPSQEETLLQTPHWSHCDECYEQTSVVRALMFLPGHSNLFDISTPVLCIKDASDNVITSWPKPPGDKNPWWWQLTVHQITIHSNIVVRTSSILKSVAQWRRKAPKSDNGELAHWGYIAFRAIWITPAQWRIAAKLPAKTPLVLQFARWCRTCYA